MQWAVQQTCGRKRRVKLSRLKTHLKNKQEKPCQHNGERATAVNRRTLVIRRLHP